MIRNTMLNLFADNGIIGLEAISRAEAKEVIMIDSNRDNIRIAQYNASLLQQHQKIKKHYIVQS